MTQTKSKSSAIPSMAPFDRPLRLRCRHHAQYRRAALSSLYLQAAAHWCKPLQARARALQRRPPLLQAGAQHWHRCCCKPDPARCNAGPRYSRPESQPGPGARLRRPAAAVDSRYCKASAALAGVRLCELQGCNSWWDGDRGARADGEDACVGRLIRLLNCLS